jgi:putative transcriptional regulator
LSRVGKLLIAHPNLNEDDWFYRTVVYIYSDSPDQGTLGLTLNVPTTMTVKGLCKQKGVIFPSEYNQVHKAGPVNETSILLLHSADWHGKNTIKAGNGYKLTSDNTMFERLSLGDEPAYWRMMMGLAVWQPNQLDMELAGTFPYKSSNSWLVCDATDDILFNYTSETQWKAAVELCSQQMLETFF